MRIPERQACFFFAWWVDNGIAVRAFRSGYMDGENGRAAVMVAMMVKQLETECVILVEGGRRWLSGKEEQVEYRIK